jgi:putative protease
MEFYVTAASADYAVSAIKNGANGVIFPPSVPRESMEGLFLNARARGVRTLLDWSWTCGDAETERRAETLRFLYPLGLDSVLVGDPGGLRAAALTAPDCELIWSGCCRTSEDIEYAAENGCSRAVMSTFLRYRDIKMLSAAAKIPLLFWLLSPLCPEDGRSGCILDKERRPDSCGQRCREIRLAHTGDAVEPLIRTRDLSLLKHIKELSGFTALVSPPVPAGAALLTRIVHDAVNGAYVDARELEDIFASMGRGKPTDAPFTGNGSIYAPEDAPALKAQRGAEYNDKNDGEQDRSRVPVRFFALVSAGEPVRLAVDDYKGHTLYAEGPMPKQGEARDAEKELNEVWRGVSGIYECRDARTQISPGLSITLEQAAALRGAVMKKLEAARMALPERKPGKVQPPAGLLPRADKPRLTVRVAKMSQITPELLGLPPERLYIPLDEASANLTKAEWLIKSETVPVAILPRVQNEGYRAEIAARLKMLHDIGFREVLTWNPGQALLAQKYGFTPRADWGAASAHTLRMAKAMGVVSCTLAPWMSLAGIGQMDHVCDTELIVYGRLPLLLARQCLIKRKDGLCVCENKCELSDGQGGLLPLIREGEHSTLVYHPQKLWMLPHRHMWRYIGLWAGRLDFVNESAKECEQIVMAFAEKGTYEPHSYTTGFYLTDEKKKRKGRRTV